MNKKQKQLMQEYPYMKCSNLLEFKQRLQWLSEGMLRNHMESVVHYQQDPYEVSLYKKFKGAKE